MTTPTSIYGNWNDFGGSLAYATIEETVTGYLGESAEDYDVTALVAAYRAAINERLPEGVSLHGNQFDEQQAERQRQKVLDCSHTFVESHDPSNKGGGSVWVCSDCGATPREVIELDGQVECPHGDHVITDASSLGGHFDGWCQDTFVP